MSRVILQEPRGTATPYLEQVFQIHNNALKRLENRGEMFFSPLYHCLSPFITGDRGEEVVSSLNISINVL